MGPSGYRSVGSDGSESLDNGKFPLVDDDDSRHSDHWFPSPPRCDDLTPEDAEHIELEFDPSMESELDRLSIHSGGTESDTDSSSESLADSVFDDMLGQYLSQHEEHHSAESEEPNPKSSCKKARKEELALLTPEELASPMALEKTHQKAPISPPPFSDEEIAGIDLLSQLTKSNSPLKQYDDISDWLNHRVLPFCGDKSYFPDFELPSRKQLLSSLIRQCNMSDLRPRNVKVVLPFRKKHVSVSHFHLAPLMQHSPILLFLIMTLIS